MAPRDAGWDSRLRPQPSGPIFAPHRDARRLVLRAEKLWMGKLPRAVRSRMPEHLNMSRMVSRSPRASGGTLPAPTSIRPQLAGDDARGTGTSGTGTSVITKVKPRAKRPNLYRVLILNDDYTPMEFVVLVLERFFQKDVEAATKIMLHVHHHGIGECGIFTYEIAETKVNQVMDFARKHQHPLQCVMEKK